LVTTLELTEAFKTKSKWRLIVAQGPDLAGSPDEDNLPGMLNFCFDTNEKPDCATARSAYNVFRSVEVIRPRYAPEAPLLVAQTGLAMHGSGYPIETIVWVYRSTSGRFEEIFSHDSNVSENEETRVIAKGPLAGDIVENEPIGRWPYPYSMKVYGLSESRHYRKILSYEGKSRWGDGNRLAAVDAEMLEIEKRLHVWKPGAPLPRPLGKPTACGAVSLHNDLLWCP